MFFKRSFVKNNKYLWESGYLLRDEIVQNTINLQSGAIQHDR